MAPPLMQIAVGVFVLAFMWSYMVPAIRFLKTILYL